MDIESGVCTEDLAANPVTNRDTARAILGQLAASLARMGRIALSGAWRVW